MTSKSNSESDFVISNKTSDKLNLLDIHGELAINIMYGLVSVSGSAKFIHEKKSKKQEVQCNFLQKITTSDEIINYKHESLRDCYAHKIENEGTHVVIGISWGANAVVTFTYENDEHLAKNEFEGKLKLDLEKLKTWASARGELRASYKDNLSLLSNQMRIKTNADVVANHEGAPRSLEEALEFIHNLPKRMADTNNGKGRQIAFHLIPLSTLKKYLQHNDTIDVVVQQIESSSITRLRQLFDDIEGAEEDLVDLLNLSRNTSFVPLADSNQIEDFYQNFQAEINKFKSLIRNILTQIKSGKIEPIEIDESRAVFSKTSDFSPCKVKEFVESCSNIKEKIALCKNFLQHGIRYISNNEEFESFKRDLCDVNCVEAYVFVGSFKKDRNEEEWRQAIDIFYTIQNEKPTGTVFAYIDKDFSFSEKLPTGIKICKFRNGSFVSKEILEQYLKREEISTFISCNKLTPNLNSNRNRVNFKAKCPETYNNGDCERIEHEWTCMACNEILTYGLDQRFYCGCGNGAICDFAFKCSSPKHGKNHVKYEHDVLENIVSKLKSRKEINILLLGETGVGKSTWINLIPNYLKYETLDEVANGQFISLIPTEFSWTTTNNEETKSKEIKTGTPDNNEVFKDRQSSTQKSKAYEFKVEDTTYRIIDTPGIGDTRGIDHDKQNAENILNLISHYGELHAICILLHPNVSKFSASFIYCFKALFTQFHRSVANNVFFSFTNTQGYGYAPAETYRSLQQLLSNYGSTIEIELNKNTMYSYDNIAYRYLCAIQDPEVLLDLITLPPEQVEAYRQSYKISRQETSRMFRTIQKQTPYLVNNSLSIYYSRKVISNLSLPLTLLATNTLTIFETILLALQLLFLPSRSYKRSLVRRIFSWKKYSKFDHMNFCTSKQVCCNKCVKKHEINLKDILEDKELPKEAIESPKGDSLKNNNLPADILRQIQIFNKTGHFEDFLMDIHLTARPNQPYIYFEYNKLQCDSLDREFCPECTFSFERKEIKRTTITYGKRQVSDKDAQKITKERQEERDELLKEVANFAIFLKHYSIAPYNDSTEDYIQILIENEKQNNDEQKVEKYEKLLEKYQQEKERLDKAFEKNKGSLSSEFSSQLTPENIMEKLKNLTKLKHYGHIVEKILNWQEDKELYNNIEKDQEEEENNGYQKMV